MPSRVRTFLSNTRVGNELARQGYSSGDAHSIRIPLLDAIVSDIRRGRTRWPVDTAYSRNNFFYRRTGWDLHNHADYAVYVERRNRSPIRRYIDKNLSSLVATAAAIAGLEKKGSIGSIFNLGIALARFEAIRTGRFAALVPQVRRF